ncbi:MULTISPECIES: glutathione peroxidase [unclassified Sphingomonas]|uniref:glutathione peroxidase n=1 Tax=unclassified Sphingomonas TaxID=196159 RepID=UPI0006F737E2|nr:MULTISPECIES: glutathione peroxidase [unclassified Sphingomonas]KQX22690.1 glutathione peroxidase [Sphingomonas sp. Root1294]KQY67830.1 glutathione peroxidase [Sphingomonas sp. Root50]KRB88754.1 glutathione peroxidase [Sphingomonas sp. Root720]
MTTAFDFSARAIDGAEVPLERYRGKVMLIVNTASKCGFTPQYEGLERLHEQLADRGLVILGFPCNQFGAQEPGDEAEIDAFCRTSYDVRFPMFAKVEVNGPHAHPLYGWLKSNARGILGTEGIKWNFTKFLIDRDGQVFSRYAPTTRPEAIRGEIEELLEGA